MYAVPLRYKAALYEGNVSVNWYGTITLTDGTTKAFTYANISEGSGQIVKKCSEASEIGIGNAYSSELSIQFKGLEVDRYAMYDAVINMYARITMQAVRVWADLEPHTWSA